ncbi:hypothetical protein [Tamaricihabitans halophyticus]|nr:hypothetical protein [Tamaricihabitans halophyticus]
MAFTTLDLVLATALGSRFATSSFKGSDVRAQIDQGISNVA